jgi:MFS superfamily sulfate permease-like transporter
VTCVEVRSCAAAGTVPSGLPHIALPDVGWSWGLIEKLVPVAFAMFVVILAQSAATSRAYAARYNENTDLVGLGLDTLGQMVLAYQQQSTTVSSGSRG